MLTKLYDRCLNGENIPHECQTCYSPIQKKKLEERSYSYRRIAVICSDSRIYSRILKLNIEGEV